MGKKQKAKKNKPAETGKTPPHPSDGGKRVRLETAVIMALVALIIGFFGGEILQRSKPSPAPHAGMTSGPPGVSHGGPPQSEGPTPEQANRIMALEKEIATNPGNVEAWTTLGHLYFDVHMFEKAIKTYKKSLELQPYNADVWTDLGVMYRRTRKPLEALAAFDKAIEIDPKHEVSRFNKGVVYMSDLDEIEKAMEAWDGLLKVNPDAKSPSGEPIGVMIEKIRKMKTEE